MRDELRVSEHHLILGSFRSTSQPGLTGGVTLIQVL